MKTTTYEFDHVVVSYFPDSQYLKITWKGVIDSEKMGHGYRLALDIIKLHPVSQCLIDMRGRELAAAGTEPLITDIFGQLLTIIRIPMFVALVLQPEAYFNITDHFHYEYLQQGDNHFVIIKHFLNEETAEEWLTASARSFPEA